MKRNASRLILASSLHKLSKKNKAAAWEDVSEKLYGSRKNRRSVNVGEIERSSANASGVIVPGKVLGGGKISRKVTVAAFSFSKEAKAKIQNSGGKCVSLSEIAAGTEMPTKGVVVLG